MTGYGVRGDVAGDYEGDARSNPKPCCKGRFLLDGQVIDALIKWPESEEPDHSVLKTAFWV